MIKWLGWLKVIHVFSFGSVVINVFSFTPSGIDSSGTSEPVCFLLCLKTLGGGGAFEFLLATLEV